MSDPRSKALTPPQQALLRRLFLAGRTLDEAAAEAGCPRNRAMQFRKRLAAAGLTLPNTRSGGRGGRPGARSSAKEPPAPQRAVSAPIARPTWFEHRETTADLMGRRA